MSSYLTDYRQHVGAKPDKFYKTTLFRGDHLMLGLNCLEPGQVQPVHDHGDQDKFYTVLEGVGVFTVGGRGRLGAGRPAPRRAQRRDGAAGAADGHRPAAVTVERNSIRRAQVRKSPPLR